MVVVRFDVEIQAQSAGEEWMNDLANPFRGEAGIARVADSWAARAAFFRASPA